MKNKFWNKLFFCCCLSGYLITFFTCRAWLTRKQLLDQCLNLEQFNHEAEQAESWMAKREAFLASGDVGSSSDAVQALIKKHEDFEKSLQAQVLNYINPFSS